VQPLCRLVPTLYRELGWQVVAEMRQDPADLRGLRADVCWMQVHCPCMVSSWVLVPGLVPMGAGEGPAETTQPGAGARPGLDGRWRRTREDQAQDCGGAQASCRAGDWRRCASQNGQLLTILFDCDHVIVQDQLLTGADGLHHLQVHRVAAI
jgi:hypothetical protein